MDQSLTRALIKAGNTVRRCADRQLEQAGIDFPKGGMRILGLLASHPERTFYQKDLEESFALARSTVSGILSELEERDLIRREPVSGDGRLKRVVLTEKALELDAGVRAQVAQLEQAALQDFTQEEKRQLLQLLERVRQNLRRC